jgi:assimilatory nitrate reductase catalytic subunit
VISSEDGRIVDVRGDESHPANFGKLCSKGSTLALTMHPNAMQGRARFPESRTSRETSRARVAWDAALDTVANKFADIIEKHGPDAVGIYVSGQLLTEDYYVFNKLAKGLIGTNNIDTNSRLCMSSAVTGYQQTLGVDAPPCSYEDIDHATCLFIAGSNTAFAHPILFRRIEAAKEKNPALKIIVVDPRRTETAAFADLYLPILPGTDVALFHAMLHVMLWEEWIDRAYIEQHTEGFDAIRATIREMTPAVAAEICGVPASDIITAAKWFAQSPATLSLYCQGLNQSTSGTAKNASLINLHLATAQIGKPGAGPFSLTGQPNAMGGREVGGLATTLAAHRSIDNPVHREEVRAFWGVDRISDQRGKTAVEMFEAAASGEIKALWIVCTNPAQSLPDLSNVVKALQTAEFVVLQDAYRNTETAAYADVLLPATSWGEKEGTVTNSERRISRVRAATSAQGEARHDWQIARDVALRLEARLRPGKASLFAFETPEQAWNEHRALTRGRDLDITGLTYGMLDAQGPQQWPFPEGAIEGKARLYEDGKFQTTSGRATFFAAKYQAPNDAVNSHFPFRLTTGRLRDQWHGMSRTGTLARLFGHAPEPALSMNPHDLARRNLTQGELVKVTSRRGSVMVRVDASDQLRSGQVYLPMHWGKRFLGGATSHGVNTLTNPAFDAFSRQPELKHAAVKVEAAAMSWHATAFCQTDDAVAFIDQLQALQDEVAFLSAVQIGRGTSDARAGLLVRVANAGAPNPAWILAFDEVLQLNHAHVLRYDDPRRGAARRVLVQGDQLIAARISGDAASSANADWLIDWMIAQRSVATIRRQLLSPLSTAPIGAAPPSRNVCECFGVRQDTIVSALQRIQGDEATRVKVLQSQLRCGTNCGSCLPELRKLVTVTTCIESDEAAIKEEKVA